MPVHNSDVSDVLNTLADLSEIKGANEFRVRAYRDAARTVDGLPRTLSEMIADGEDLSELPGIGESIAEKIEEIVQTGRLKQLEKLKRRVPGELSELLAVPGLGPKRVKMLHDHLDVVDRDDLAAAAREGKVRQLKGLGPKTEQQILDELKKDGDRKKRFPLADVEETAESLLAYLRGVEGVEQAVIAGMRYGIDQARRGWLEADDVINTRSWSELQELLKRD